MFNNLKKNIVAGFLAFLLALLPMVSLGNVVVNAEEVTVEKQYTLGEETFDSKEQIEQELKFLFEEASNVDSNGFVSVNESLIAQKYGIEVAPYIAEGIKRLHTDVNIVQNINPNYLEEHTPVPEVHGSHLRGAWLDCMKGEIIGLIPGMDLIQLFASGELVAFIKGEAWGVAADFIARQAVKLGLNSNVAGLAASLAVSAGRCAL